MTREAGRQDPAQPEAEAPAPAYELPQPGSCNSLALRKAMRRVSHLYDGVVADTGLRMTQISILIHIARAKAPNMGELAGRLVLDRSALNENLKPLIRAGLVENTPDPHDRRNRRVRLTPAGHTKLAASLEHWRTAQKRFEVAFGAADAAELRRTLDRISSDAFAVAFDEETRLADR